VRLRRIPRVDNVERNQGIVILKKWRFRVEGSGTSRKSEAFKTTLRVGLLAT